MSNQGDGVIEVEGALSPEAFTRLQERWKAAHTGGASVQIIIEARDLASPAIARLLRPAPWRRRLWRWPGLWVKHYHILRRHSGRWEALKASFHLSRVILYRRRSSNG